MQAKFKVATLNIYERPIITFLNLNHLGNGLRAAQLKF
jgi:hypothetical protein